jgi:hypothetical protein
MDHLKDQILSSVCVCMVGQGAELHKHTWGDLLFSRSLLFLLLDPISKNAQGHYQFVLGPHRGALYLWCRGGQLAAKQAE